ncbi:MAG: carboxypeptidase-like regulatory domain-containing protein [Planctomycetota bacterium]
MSPISKLSGVGLVALVGSAGLSFWRAGDVAAAEAELGEHHRAVHELPFEDFVEDRANRMRGRVVAGDGSPLAGVEVRVYAHDEWRRSVREAPRGAPPVPAVEASARTGADGRFRIGRLSYGSKVLVAGAPGIGYDQHTEHRHSDGYGTPNVSFVLRRGEDQRVHLIEGSGRSLAGAELRLLPRLVGASEVRVRSDAVGILRVPGWAVAPTGLPRALVGDPPLLIDLDRNEGVAIVPEWRPLRVDLGGAAAGPVDVIWCATSARQLPARFRLEPGADGELELPPLPLVDCELRFEQPDRIGALAFLHDGSPRAAELLRREPLTVLVRSESGEPLAASLAWQAGPFAIHESIAVEPNEAWARRDPTTVSLRSDGDGRAVFAPRPLAAGQLLVEAPGHAPTVVQVDAAAGELEVTLKPARLIRIGTVLGFYSIRVQGASGPPQLGRTDALAEARAFLPDGPMLAWKGLESGSLGYPVGGWVGRGLPQIRLSQLDDPGRTSGCVFGFIVDHAGAPVAGAKVFLQHSGERFPREAEADEVGFYRFVGVEAGQHIVVARRADAEHPVLTPRPATIVRPEPGPRVGDGALTCRVDVELRPGVIRVEGPPPSVGEEPHELRVEDDKGNTVLRVAVDGEELRITNLPEGIYALFDSPPGGGEPRALGSVELFADGRETGVVTW